MEAHDHPAFVEDMARDLSQACRERGIAHVVSVRNFESIHSHDAVASVSWQLRV
jgi:GTP cyclohydrolase I